MKSREGLTKMLEFSTDTACSWKWLQSAVCFVWILEHDWGLFFFFFLKKSGIRPNVSVMKLRMKIIDEMDFLGENHTRILHFGTEKRLLCFPAIASEEISRYGWRIQGPEHVRETFPQHSREMILHIISPAFCENMAKKVFERSWMLEQNPVDQCSYDCW